MAHVTGVRCASEKRRPHSPSTSLTNRAVARVDAQWRCAVDGSDLNRVTGLDLTPWRGHAQLGLKPLRKALAGKKAAGRQILAESTRASKE